MYKKIMVTLDGSELSECVLPHVTALLQGFPTAEVVFVRVVEPGPDVTAVRGDSIRPDQWKERETALKSSADSYLTGVMNRLEHGETPLRSEVLVGRVAEIIAEYAEGNGIDLICIATHGRSGVSRWVRGSVADRILRSASVPVLMVRAPGTKGGDLVKGNR